MTSAGDQEGQSSISDQHQAPASVENPLDMAATELISSIQQRLQQKLLGQQPVAASTAGTAPNAAQALELQQAHHLIAQLQR